MIISSFYILAIVQIEKKKSVTLESNKFKQLEFYKWYPLPFGHHGLALWPSLYLALASILGASGQLVVQLSTGVNAPKRHWDRIARTTFLGGPHKKGCQLHWCSLHKLKYVVITCQQHHINIWNSKNWLTSGKMDSPWWSIHETCCLTISGCSASSLCDICRNSKLFQSHFWSDRQ